MDWSWAREAETGENGQDRQQLRLSTPARSTRGVVVTAPDTAGIEPESASDAPTGL